MSDEEKLKILMKTVYPPVSPPPGLRECLRQRLTLQAAGREGASHSATVRSRAWLPVAIGLISGAIGYGAWLSLNIATQMIH